MQINANQCEPMRANQCESLQIKHIKINAIGDVKFEKVLILETVREVCNNFFYF